LWSTLSIRICEEYLKLLFDRIQLVEDSSFSTYVVH